MSPQCELRTVPISIYRRGNKTQRRGITFSRLLACMADHDATLHPDDGVEEGDGRKDEKGDKGKESTETGSCEQVPRLAGT